MSHSITPAADLVLDGLSLIEALTIERGVLDLACGDGRNGLAVLAANIPVTFADRDAQKLEALRSLVDTRFPAQRDLASFWAVDLEEPDTHPLVHSEFDAALVFNYLHRPLFPDLRSAIRPGGLVFYETFTRAQADIGRPRNPDYLLRSKELPTYFEDWELLHSFEGIMHNPTRAKASLIARRT